MKKKIDILTVKIVFVLMLSVIITGTVTYGFFIASKRQTGENKIASGCFNVVKKSESESLSLANAYSISDEEGMKSTPYTLTIENTCSIDAYYNLVIDTKSGSFESEYINYSLDGSSAETLGNRKKNTSFPAGTGYDHSYVIGAGTLKTGEEKTFTIRLWINAATTYEDVRGKGWEGQVRIVNTVDDLKPIPAKETLQALHLTSRGKRKDFDSPSPLPGEGVTSIVSSAKYKNVMNVTMEPAESYVVDVDGVYTSQNEEESTITLSPSEEGKYYVCYEASVDEENDGVEIYLDDELKKEVYSDEGNCIDLGTINNSNQVKVTYHKYGTDESDKIKVYLATEATIGKTSDSDSGIYEMKDDYGVSYYFRGAVENNYMRFGKWAEGTEHAGSDMYWRIVRINGDGSLRMIYDGTSAHANDEQDDDTFIGTSAFNAKHDDAKYVGYMFGPANEVESTTTPSTSKEEAQSNVASSDIKEVIDKWYETNLATEYGKYLSDTAFCYDRSTSKGASGWSSDTGLGYGKNLTGYGAMNRFVDVSSGSWGKRAGITPTFKCPNKNDSYTTSDRAVGNASLDYPVGLLSADEIVAAGSGGIWPVSNHYLKRSSLYWSGSPSDYSAGNAGVFYVHTSGALDIDYVDITSRSVAPVINLSAEYVKTLKGDGKIGSEPFHL